MNVLKAPHEQLRDAIERERKKRPPVLQDPGERVAANERSIAEFRNALKEAGCKLPLRREKR